MFNLGRGIGKVGGLLIGNVMVRTFAGTPVDGAAGTFAGQAGPGSLIIDSVGFELYQNRGTRLSPIWAAGGNSSRDVTISPAAIVAVGAGNLGHVNGFELVPAPGAGKALLLNAVVLVLDFGVAAYGAGGNVTVNLGGGGAALTGLVSAANSIGAAADKVVGFYPLAAGAAALAPNVGINLVSAAAFTQPGTAAGVVRVKTFYRTIATGL